MRVAIIGAGISGLATAYYLQRQRPDWELLIFDAAPRVGGTLRTAEVDGFLFEEGANGFLSNKTDTLELAEECGAYDQLLPAASAAQRRFIYTDRLHPLPESPTAFVGSRLLSWPQKMRVAMELFVPPLRDERDESLQAFGYRRLGRGFTDTLLDAMSAGIYAATPEGISVQAAFPRVAQLERHHGGLFRAMLARRSSQTGPGGRLTSFRGGMSRFVEQLRSRIQARWHLGEPVRGIVRDADRYLLQVGSGHYRVERLVVATPAYIAATLLRGVDEDIARRLEDIAYAPLAVVGMGFRRAPQGMDGFGLLTTRGSGVPVLGVVWDSSIFPDRAPPGAATLRVLIGGQRSPELAAQDDAALTRTAALALSRTMGLEAMPDVVHIKRWTHAIPSYPCGHLPRVAGIFKALGAYPGLFLTGNAYFGIAMNDCIHNSRELAQVVAAQDDQNLKASEYFRSRLSSRR